MEIFTEKLLLFENLKALFIIPKKKTSLKSNSEFKLRYI